MKRRMLAVIVVISLMLATVSVRLYTIANGIAYTSASSQGRYTLTVCKPRGTVYDCNMRRLTNTASKTVAAMPATAEAVAAVTRSLGVNAQAVLERLKYGKPVLCEVPIDFECAGAYEFSVAAELNDSPLACHIIGYTDSQGNGVTGIQYAYNSLLSCAQPLEVTYTVDASGRALSGVKAELSGNSINSNGVVLTVDSQIQRIAELYGAVLEKGAVIVMDSASGKIRALASFPSYSPDNVAQSLDAADAPLINRALTAYNVGSVFKLCVAAAALRQGISAQTEYECQGYTVIGETRFNCNKHQGHGVLDMTSALAKSCNCYFISLAKEVGASALYDTCIRLGFNRAYSLADGITAAVGALPSLSSIATQPAALANLSFGQGDLMLTPLHIAVMVAAIANGGSLVTPSIVEATADAQAVTPAKTANARRILSQADTASLRLMMQAVIAEGTGTAAKPNIATAGGKTATAETGWYIDGRAVTQSWFAGYCGDYTVVIIKEDGSSGSADCAPVFKSVCDAINQL